MIEEIIQAINLNLPITKEVTITDSVIVLIGKEIDNALKQSQDKIDGLKGEVKDMHKAHQRLCENLVIQATEKEELKSKIAELEKEKGKIFEKDKWLRFVEVVEINKKRKTQTFVVMSKCFDCELGRIKWYPQWRNYVFQVDDLLFSDRCLFTIGKSIMYMNKEHKRQLKQKHKEAKK